MGSELKRGLDCWFQAANKLFSSSLPFPTEIGKTIYLVELQIVRPDATSVIP